MRVDICSREDMDTQAVLLQALAEIGAIPDQGAILDLPLGQGLHRFIAPEGVLTVFADAWGVDLEGPDALVQRVQMAMAKA
jgi:hypothetical protein